MANDNFQSPLYRNLGYDNNYTIFTGKFVLPVAQSTPNGDAQAQSSNYKPVVVVQAFAPYRIRTVNYQSKKEINPPQIPTPTDSGPYTFLGGSVTLPLPQINSAGTFSWAAATNYIFVENIYSDINSGYILGQPPFIWNTQIAEGGNVSQNGGPLIVQQSGIGPKVGYADSTLLNNADANYNYIEPSYFPAFFHSNDLISGPTSYPGQF